MIIPSIEEVKFPINKIEDICLVLEENSVGDRPLYVLADEHVDFQTMDLLDNINQAFKIINIHPLFPYPFYFISEKNVIYPSLVPVVRSVRELPRYYFVKKKRPNKTEQDLLKRISIVQQQLKALDIPKIYEVIGDYSSECKLLYQLTNEAQFYDTILKKIEEIE